MTGTIQGMPVQLAPATRVATGFEGNRFEPFRSRRWNLSPERTPLPVLPHTGSPTGQANTGALCRFGKTEPSEASGKAKSPLPLHAIHRRPAATTRWETSPRRARPTRREGLSGRA